MTFTVYKTSNPEVNSEIEITTLDQLIDFVNRVKHEVIIAHDLADKNEWTLEIYDDWRE